MVRLKRFQKEGCVSYLVFEPTQREALLIDPRADLLPEYRSAMADLGLHCTCVFETKLHSHHYSGSHALRAELGCEIFMALATESQRPTHKFRNGDSFLVGKIKFEVWETPGNASDSACLLTDGMIFTGDTLWIGSVAEANYLGSDPEKLWESQRRISQLKPETLIFAAHDSEELFFSTIAVEIKKNLDLIISDRAHFMERKKISHRPTPDEETVKKRNYNRVLLPETVPTIEFSEAERNPFRFKDSYALSLNVEKFAAKAHQKKPSQLFIDIREKPEFERGHIPGAIHIPGFELGFHAAELRKAEKIFLYCQSGGRSPLVSRNLLYLGFPDVTTLAGGFQAWLNAGFSVAK